MKESALVVVKGEGGGIHFGGGGVVVAGRLREKATERV